VNDFASDLLQRSRLNGDGLDRYQNKELFEIDDERRKHVDERRQEVGDYKGGVGSALGHRIGYGPSSTASYDVAWDTNIHASIRATCEYAYTSHCVPYDAGKEDVYRYFVCEE
jgi:hypothetical protein